MSNKRSVRPTRPIQIKITKTRGTAMIEVLFGFMDVSVHIVNSQKWREFLEQRGWVTVPRVWGPTTD